MSARVLEPRFASIAAPAPDERVLVVTHGGPIRAALAHVEGISHSEARRSGPALGNCVVAGLALEDGEFRRID